MNSNFIDIDDVKQIILIKIFSVTDGISIFLKFVKELCYRLKICNSAYKCVEELCYRWKMQ